MEHEVQADIDAGRVHQYGNVENMISWLNEKDENAPD
jgi:hypothetical protein